MSSTCPGITCGIKLTPSKGGQGQDKNGTIKRDELNLLHVYMYTNRGRERKGEGGRGRGEGGEGGRGRVREEREGRGRRGRGENFIALKKGQRTQ